MKVEAPYLFESFMLYMEKNRPPEERFYEPRRNPLKQVADAIQEPILREILSTLPKWLSQLHMTQQEQLL